MVMVSFKGAFCLFYLDLWCRSWDLLLFDCFTCMVMVSFKGSFVVCLFYLDGYGVVQWIFCCLLVLPWWLWCRSRDLLLFVCFILMVMVSFKGSLVVCLFYLYGYGVVQGIFCLFYFVCVVSFLLDGYGVVHGIFCCLIVLPWWLWCRSMDLLLFACFTLVVMVSFNLLLFGSFVIVSKYLFVCFTFMVMVSFKGSFVVCLFYLYSYGVVQGIFWFLLVLPWWLWCRSRDLLLFVCFTLMVTVWFNGSFVVCLFYLDGYGVVQGIFCCLLVLPLWLWCRSRDLLLFVCFTLMVMVSFNGSFVVCLFYLDGYGVVQGIFCCLLVLPWWLWCRSMDLLLFVCFTFMVMVSFNGSFVVCLFYLDSYGVVQGIFCFLLVLPWWLWCRSRDLLLFACFTFIVMVSFKRSFVVCLFYLYSYGVVQWDLLLFACFTLMVMVSFKGSFVVCLFYLYSYGVVQGIFCCLLVLPLWLWCLDSYGVVQWIFCFLVCFTLFLMVMVSFKGSFVVCLFYLYGYGVVQGIFCCLFVLPWWLWCRSRDLLLFACFTLMVMVSFKGSFVVCLFYLDGYGVVQGIFCCLLVLPLWLWCRSRDRLFFAC